MPVGADAADLRERIAGKIAASPERSARMSESTVLTPIAASERIEAMDVLRGFALLGILLMNIEAFVGPMVASLSGLDPTLTGADRIVDAAISILVQGKFYLLFSLLFGMGFGVMMQRAAMHGHAFAALYLRRTLALLAIGLIHLLLIWSGDILTVYALIAIPLLVVFRQVPTGQLPYWALGLYALTLLMVAGFSAMGVLAQFDPAAAAMVQDELQKQAAQMARLMADERAAYGSGSYAQAVAQRMADAAVMVPYILLLGGQILAMFVLGAWFVRSGAIAQPQVWPRLYAALRWVALPVGLCLMLLSFWMVPTMAFDRLDLTSTIATVLMLIAAPLMSLGYLAWILRALNAGARWLRWLAPAGRMALTNYLGQSLVCTLVFYGYGLGYFEQLPRAWQVPFVFALFALQVVFSRWWLARYRYGPAEWVWRAVTYLRVPAMRVSAAD